MNSSLAIPPPAVAAASPAPLDVGALFAAHGAFLHRVAQRLVGSAALADDVVQEVFLVAVRRRLDLDVRLGIRTWLYRTAVNVARQGFRTDRRYADAMTRLTALPELQSSTPEREEERRRSGQQVRACIANLSEAQREVFVLFELEELDGVEIAEILEIPINTVWSRLRLARAAFRAQWTSQPDATP
jgi:RNA polymerase sigma-70 factor, ECF subfamily